MFVSENISLFYAERQQIFKNLKKNLKKKKKKNPWSQYFQNGELEKVIEQDLKRLFPEYEFFQRRFVQDIMKRVLFVWSLENPEYSYRQGMHEVLAPVLLVVHRDALHGHEYFANKKKLADSSSLYSMMESISSSSSSASQYSGNFEEAVAVGSGGGGGANLQEVPEPSSVAGPDITNLLSSFFDMQYLEHDSYCIFATIMTTLKSWFHVNDKKKASAGYPLQSTLFKETSNGDSLDEAPIIQVCKKIQNELLKKKDGALAAHLEKLGIEPQIYGL